MSSDGDLSLSEQYVISTLVEIDQNRVIFRGEDWGGGGLSTERGIRAGAEGRGGAATLRRRRTTDETGNRTPNQGTTSEVGGGQETEGGWG